MRVVDLGPICIVEVNLVVNDGVECTFSGVSGSKRAEEVYPLAQIWHQQGTYSSLSTFAQS